MPRHDAGGLGLPLGRNDPPEPQRGRHPFGQRGHIPHPLGRKIAIGRTIPNGQAITLIIQNLEILGPRQGRNLASAFGRCVDGGGIVRMGRCHKQLHMMRTTGRLERGGHRPLFVLLNRHQLCPRQPRRMADTGIGKLFGQDHRSIAAQNRLIDQVDRVLPPIGQCHVLFAQDRTVERRHIAKDQRFQLQLIHLLRVIHNLDQRHLIRPPSHQGPYQLALPHIG